MVIKDGAKMSKSLGNVVDPNVIMDKYGPDTAKLFILFAASPEKELDWSDQGVVGSYKFICRAYSLFEKDQKMEKVTSAVDLINQKYGYYTILPASLLGIEIIRPEVNGYFGDKSYQLKFNDLDTFK